jgi:hypothetical protein
MVYVIHYTTLGEYYLLLLLLISAQYQDLAVVTAEAAAC